MRENRLYGSVGGWGLNRPPPTQSRGPQRRAQRGVNCARVARTIARTESHAKKQRRKEDREGELLLQDEWGLNVRRGVAIG